jgi:hypothetical protein
MTELAKLPKALESHTRTFYGRLELLAKEDPEMGLVVETRISHLFQELDIPTTYYARIRAILFDGADPCAVMLRRGTHGKPSVVVLRHPPTVEMFSDEGLTLHRAAATVFLDAAERIEKLEAWRDSLIPADENRLNVVEALRNHERRLATLEAYVASLIGETNGKNAQDPTD